MTSEAIREAERRRQEYNVILGEDGYELIYRNRPYDQEKVRLRLVPTEPDVEQHRRQRMIIL